MTPEQSRTADKMKSVRAAWDKAPAGRKTDRALQHCQAAETAHTAKNDAETGKELDAATRDPAGRLPSGVACTPPLLAGKPLSQLWGGRFFRWSR